MKLLTECRQEFTPSCEVRNPAPLEPIGARSTSLYTLGKRRRRTSSRIVAVSFTSVGLRAGICTGNVRYYMHWRKDPHGIIVLCRFLYLQASDLAKYFENPRRCIFDEGGSARQGIAQTLDYDGVDLMVEVNVHLWAFLVLKEDIVCIGSDSPALMVDVEVDRRTTMRSE